MQPELFCQSCTMPIDKIENRGTEKNGTNSELYCKYCYKDGLFTTPDMTLEQMKEICTEQMKKQNIAPEILAQSMKMLPLLKRWNKINNVLK